MLKDLAGVYTGKRHLARQVHCCDGTAGGATAVFVVPCPIRCLCW